MSTLHPALFPFLTSIAERNSRDFFATVKPLYEEILQSVQAFCDTMIQRLSIIDPALEWITHKDCMFRIYRDARRLKPWDLLYKQQFSFYIAPWGKKDTKAWYYIHLQPGGESFFAGWVYRPTPVELRSLRRFLSFKGNEYYALTRSQEFVQRFGTVDGDVLKSLPRGFDQYTPFLELVQRKQFLIDRHYTDEQVMSSDFFECIIDDCRLAKPRFDLLNEGMLFKTS